MSQKIQAKDSNSPAHPYMWSRTLPSTSLRNVSAGRVVYSHDAPYILRVPAHELLSICFPYKTMCESQEQRL